MKENNFNHLKLDNFTSFKSDFGPSGKRRRNQYDLNKENDIQMQGYFGTASTTTMGVGGVLNSPGFSYITPRFSLSNICNDLNMVAGNRTTESVQSNLSMEKTTCFSKLGSFKNFDEISSTSGTIEIDGVFTTPVSSSITQIPPLSDISNNIHMVEDVPVELYTASKKTRVKRSAPKTSVLTKKTSRRFDHSKLEESSTRLFVPDPVLGSVLDDQVDYNIDIPTINNEYLEEDDEMLYDGDLVNGSDSDEEEIVFDDKVIPKDSGYCSLGPPTAVCHSCNAIMWKEERVNKNVKKGTPEFSMCCAKGQINLPKAPSPPSYMMQLYNDPKKGKNFKNNIRLYNSMFAFTSMGGKVDHSINTGCAPYIYRLNGQNHHVFGSLIPNDGDDPNSVNYTFMTLKMRLIIY